MWPQTKAEINKTCLGLHVCDKREVWVNRCWLTSLGVLWAAHKKIHCSVAVIWVQVSGWHSLWRRKDEHQHSSDLTFEAVIVFALSRLLMYLLQSFKPLKCSLFGYRLWYWDKNLSDRSSSHQNISNCTSIDHWPVVLQLIHWAPDRTAYKQETRARLEQMHTSDSCFSNHVSGLQLFWGHQHSDHLYTTSMEPTCLTQSVVRHLRQTTDPNTFMTITGA